MGFLRYPIKSGIGVHGRNTFIQGGTCHAEGSYGNGYYNAFPIAFSSIAVVIPHQMGPNRNYTNYVNLRSKTLEGFTLVGNTNENFATTDGIFLAIGV